MWPIWCPRYLFGFEIWNKVHKWPCTWVLFQLDLIWSHFEHVKIQYIPSIYNIFFILNTIYTLRYNINSYNYNISLLLNAIYALGCTTHPSPLSTPLNFYLPCTTHPSSLSTPLYFYLPCTTREGVQSSSNSNHRHPNLFCGKRAPQLVITVKFCSLWFEFNALLTQFSTSIGVLWHLYWLFRFQICLVNKNWESRHSSF